MTYFDVLKCFPSFPYRVTAEQKLEFSHRFDIMNSCVIRLECNLIECNGERKVSIRGIITILVIIFNFINIHAIYEAITIEFD